MPSKTNVSIRTVENRKQLAIRLVLALVFAYIFASLAIDSGSYWHYIATFISIALGVNAGGRLFKDIAFKHDSKRNT